MDAIQGPLGPFRRNQDGHASAPRMTGRDVVDRPLAPPGSRRATSRNAPQKSWLWSLTYGPGLREAVARRGIQPIPWSGESRMGFKPRLDPKAIFPTWLHLGGPTRNSGPVAGGLVRSPSSSDEGDPIDSHHDLISVRTYRRWLRPTRFPYAPETANRPAPFPCAPSSRSACGIHGPSFVQDNVRVVQPLTGGEWGPVVIYRHG